MPSHPATHCLKCKTKTATKNPSIHATAKGGSMVRSTCGTCGKNKCTMVAKGGGLFGSLLGAAAPALLGALPF